MADDVGPVELECVHQRQHGLREELRVVAGADRLVGGGAGRQVSCNHAPPLGGEGRDRRQERRLRPAEPVQHQQWLADPGLDGADRTALGWDRLETEPAGLAAAAGRRKEVDTYVEVVPDLEPTATE